MYICSSHSCLNFSHIKDPIYSLFTEAVTSTWQLKMPIRVCPCSQSRFTPIPFGTFFPQSPKCFFLIYVWSYRLSSLNLPIAFSAHHTKSKHHAFKVLLGSHPANFFNLIFHSPPTIHYILHLLCLSVAQNCKFHSCLECFP